MVRLKTAVLGGSHQCVKKSADHEIPATEPYTYYTIQNYYNQPQNT